MSLSNLLTSKAVDEGLDDIFKSSAGPSSAASTVPAKSTSAAKKRSLDGTTEDKTVKTSQKKPRVSTSSVTKNDENKTQHKKQSKEGKRAEVKEETNINEVNAGSSDDDDDDDARFSIPQHESLKRSEKRKKEGTKKVKYVPEGETKEWRDARTIFIGNLPVAVVKSKPLTKQLKRHILSYIPSAEIESIRYRSIAFSNPTATLEEETDEKVSRKQKRQQKRTADWRAQKEDANHVSKQEKEEEENKKGEKSYMTPAEKRRLAAIKGELHEHSAATTNAYTVFAYPVPTESDEYKPPVPRKEVMDPFAAAREAVNKINGTFFAEHMLRVDFVKKPADVQTSSESTAAVGALTDPKQSVFVGNLDFATSEDDLRAFFEEVMCEERGQPSSDMNVEDGKADTLQKAKWVTRVRVVRDRETQLGKGFAYVQFSDRECVDEVLALESDKLKFAKRTLRLQRCKSGSAKAAKPQSSPSTPKVTSGTTINPRSRPSAIDLPKGDPTLGQRIASLPKESRKQAKAADPTRVARRLAKKKARMAMEKASGKDKRVRERKDKKAKGTLNTGRKGKKRERSQRNLERKNIKK
ncbi:uncharacterized protein FOMMEDRAFT_144269 [Fomitiporia mediterranea MF3/22]|uniref:uncharacterized protein n=1 Tax=Fomitiporia mediterranea (strain MF3/22) TaxID=694068 RepID=UPI0004407A02|nr:uncharacterized protein FOMMEDRAFT_144269 [Fomitiporia mediterranea MF3/22]EJD08288.1 hypothetical protein FOMMEDRAFT_144269 [Fomitiporia mediterranea MF3/22]